jgi:hypothetical protein
MNTISGRQKAGLAIAGFLSLINVASAFFPTPEGEEGPPYAILVLGTILGVIGLVAVVIAWRSGNQAAFRVAAGALIINAIASLPAFFVDVPAGIKLMVAVGLVITILAIVLMFSSARRPVPVMD